MTTKTQREIADAVRDAQFEGRMDNFEFKLDELKKLIEGIAAEIKTTQVVQFDVAQLKIWKLALEQEQKEYEKDHVPKERFERLEGTVYKILWGFGMFIIAAICYAIFGPGVPKL